MKMQILSVCSGSRVMVVCILGVFNLVLNVICNVE